MHTEDETWMRRCLVLAEAAGERGDARVGAVIVRENQSIAEASEQVVLLNDPTAHAELLAIREACRELKTRDLSECVLYTNVEPCWMCAYAIRDTGIARVVIGVPVEDIGGATSRYPLLTDPEIPGWNAPPRLTWGVLEEACGALSARE
jgi:tRNA(adenine34) deaminase